METLILFATPPAAGTTHPRLARERSARDAVRLGSGFLEDTARLCARWRTERAGADQNRKVVFCVDGAVDDPIIKELASIAGARVERQQGTTLGERLQHAFTTELDRGARAVCAIGADTPTLPSWLLDHAFRALLWERVVLGPTFNGGVWLLGVQRPAPDVFSSTPWSTPAVLAVMSERLRAQGIEPHLLPFWYDVDAAADLERLVWHTRALRAHDVTAVDGTWRALTDTGLVVEERQ